MQGTRRDTSKYHLKIGRKEVRGDDVNRMAKRRLKEMRDWFEKHRINMPERLAIVCANEILCFGNWVKEMELVAKKLRKRE